MANKKIDRDKISEGGNLSTIVSPSEFDFSKSSFDGQSCCAYYAAAYSLDMLRLFGVDEDEPKCRIHSGTKVICDNAFQAFGKSNIETIFIPDSIEKIGKNAIDPKVCLSLKRIEIPKGTTTKFKKLLNRNLWKFIAEIPIQETHSDLNTDPPTSLENEDFVIHFLSDTPAYYSSDLSKFYGLRDELNGVQYQCYEYQILNGTKVICDRAFYEHDTIETVVIPDSVIRIGVDVFKHCPNLKDICIPQGTKTRFLKLLGSKIGNDLVEIDIPHVDVPDLDFDADTSVKEQDYLPENSFIQLIDADGVAIYSRDHKKLIEVNNENEWLIEYNILYGTEVICDGAFKYCENLEVVSIPESVTSIGKNVFLGCKNLNKIIVAKGTKDFYSSLLQDDFVNKISEEIIKEKNIDTCLYDQINGVFYSIDFSTVIRYAYNIQFPTKVNILDGTKALADYSSHNEDITILSLPDSIISIGKESVFSQKLTSIQVPKGRLAKFRQLITDKHFESLLSDGTFTLQNKPSIKEKNIGEAKATVIELQTVASKIAEGTNNKGLKSHQKNQSKKSSLKIEKSDINKSVTTKVEKKEVGGLESNANMLDSQSPENGIEKNDIVSTERPEIIDCPYVIDSFRDSKKKKYFGVANYNTLRTILYDFFDKTLNQYDVLGGTEMICDNAFKGTSLTVISLPKSIKRIGSGVFDDCKNLKHIEIPNGTNDYFTKILDSDVCKYLKEVVEEKPKKDHRKDICAEDLERTFLYTVSPNNINEGIRYSKDGKKMLFITKNCSAKEVQILPGTEVLCNPLSNTFDLKDSKFGSIGIENIILPSTVTLISEYALSACFKLTNIIISSTRYATFARLLPNKWDLLTDETMKRPYELKNDRNVIKYGTKVIIDKCFQNNTSTMIMIPKTVERIEKNAFDHADIETIYIPDSVTLINDCAFQYCKSLKSVRLPDFLKAIPKDMLYKCESLENLTIPEHVKSIGKHSFAYCKSLKTITFLSKDLNSIEKGWISSNPFKGCDALQKIIVPKASLHKYKALFKGLKVQNILTCKK